MDPNPKMTPCVQDVFLNDDRDRSARAVRERNRSSLQCL